MADPETDESLINLLFGPFKQGGENISERKKYNEYVRRMQSQGKEPVSFQEFKAGQR